MDVGRSRVKETQAEMGGVKAGEEEEEKEE